MMRLDDLVAFSYHALFHQKLRAFLMLLAMAIGVASVIILITLAEASRTYVVSRFASLGTNLLIVIPGRTETTGGMPPLLGETPRDLTINDAQALAASSLVGEMAPIVVGNAPISYGQLEREIAVLGTTPSFLPIRHLNMAKGSFLPKADPYRAQQVCVLGGGVAEEIFGSASPLGKIIRLGDSRFRVIGTLAKGGVSIGVDLDDLAIVPVVSAQSLFNTESLFRIIVEAADRDVIPRLKTFISKTIKSRHDGEDDITIITQDAVLSTFDKIFTVLTLTVAGIAGISLLVAGVLVMNVMLVTVSQRTSEIGLLKALGAPAGQILVLFLSEAALLAFLGGAFGVLLSIFANEVLQRVFRDFPLHLPLWAVVASLVVAVGIGLVFAALPARRAARLEAVEALSGH